MGIAVKFSPEDMKRGTLLDVEWYTVQIDEVTEAIAKNGQSTNYVLKGTILRNATTGDSKYNGFPTPYWNFNSKAPGFMIGFFKALNINVEADKAYDLEAAKGKVLDVFIEHDEYNGQTVNRINHKYRATKA